MSQSPDYAKLAQKLVQRALKQGATQAEVFIEVSRDSSCRVRDGQIEDLTGATSKGVGIRVICQGRLGFVYSSDFAPSVLEGFVDRAVALAKVAAKNPWNVLPDRAELASKAAPVEGLFDPAVASLPSDWKVKAALEMERAGKALDPRITAFEGVGAGESVSEVHVASSEGAKASFEGTSVYLYAAPVASDGQQLQTSYWIDYRRHLSELDSPESVGLEAARRALRMLGARKVPSARVPVIFDPLMAASFVSNIASFANGDAIYKKASVFADKLDTVLGPSWLNVIDDGRRARGVGSSPFDGEGVPTRKTPLIENGKLRSFLYDASTARKAKTKTTANAARGYSSLPHIGTHNLYLEPGTRSPEEIIGEVKNGFYVTAMLGRGADPVTGSYSRGANGIWIENGQLAYPVQEVTVAGNLLQMLKDLDAAGSDLTFRGSTGAPTLRFAEMTVSGA
jgi:PmbA protein